MPERAGRVGAAIAAAGLALVPMSAVEAREPTVETLGGNRYRLSVSIRTDSQPMEYANAQAELRQAAERVCQGHGRALADGPVEVGSAPRGRTSLSLLVRCAADQSAPTATH